MCRENIGRDPYTLACVQKTEIEIHTGMCPGSKDIDASMCLGSRDEDTDTGMYPGNIINQE